uniref:Uncharacterized protein n=1 Tax=Rhizophora mucronata TaxID=61149 RepID=A0A2P2IX22_RHIMU
MKCLKKIIPFFSRVINAAWSFNNEEA